MRAQIKTEGQPAFPETPENDNSAASPTEKTNGDQPQSQSGEQSSADADNGKKDGAEDRGFADDPRWKQREGDWKQRFNDQETRHVQELAKLREEFEGKLKAVMPPKDTDSEKTPTEIPAWFGGDAEAWAEFVKYNDTLLSKASENAYNRLKTEKETEQKTIEDATKKMNDAITAIESDKDLNPSGEKIDRNKLFKVAQDFDLVTSDGNWNWKAAYLMLKNQFKPKTPDTKDRKDLASATTSDNSPEPQIPNVSTSEDFKKPGARPW